MIHPDTRILFSAKMEMSHQAMKTQKGNKFALLKWKKPIWKYCRPGISNLMTFWKKLKLRRQ